MQISKRPNGLDTSCRDPKAMRCIMPKAYMHLTTLTCLYSISSLAHSVTQKSMLRKQAFITAPLHALLKCLGYAMYRFPKKISIKKEKIYKREIINFQTSILPY